MMTTESERRPFNPGLTKLKVKIKSLADEAKIIRHEEKKWGPRRERSFEHMLLHDSLRDHRRLDVRSEARAAHLAYAYLKGRDYIQVENHLRDPNDSKHMVIWHEVSRLVKKYGTHEDRVSYEYWEKDAKRYIDGQNR